MENDRFFSLIKLKGVSQTHLCSLVGRTRHYLQDVKVGKSTPPESFVRIWAEALDTSYEYLMGMDEPQRVVIDVGASSIDLVQNSIFNELYQQIAEKKTAEADLAELERFMEYLVKRGE
jgi:transcriptional regulator with XRE-family HTH domain